MVFKTATLVYKFLHTGFPRYFAPYLSSYNISYSTWRSQSGGNFLVIPKFYPSVHKSVKQFGINFAFDAPTVWNALSDEIRASPSLAYFRKQLKTYLYPKAYPPGSSPGVLCGALPFFCLWILKFSRLLFWFCCALESSCMGRLSAIKVQLELFDQPSDLDIYIHVGQ